MNTDTQTRRQGETPLRGRPLDDNGNIELEVPLSPAARELRETQSRLRNAGQRNGELCGRIESLEGDRDHYKAHADKLAEALRRFTESYRMQSDHDLECAEAEATKALAAYEEAKQ